MDEIMKRPQPSASDVAKYLLTQKGSLTGYQIQKLLYYCQAWSLVVNQRPLFPDEIQAWKHGPVVPSVSRQHQNRRIVQVSDIAGNADNVGFEDQRIIDAVLSTYGTMTGDALAALSHNEDPWGSAFNGCTGSGSAVISLDSMASYYSVVYASSERVRAEHHVPRFDHPRTLYVGKSDYDWLLEYLND